MRTVSPSRRTRGSLSASFVAASAMVVSLWSGFVDLQPVVTRKSKALKHTTFKTFDNLSCGFLDIRSPASSFRESTGASDLALDYSQHNKCRDRLASKSK